MRWEAWLGGWLKPLGRVVLALAVVAIAAATASGLGFSWDPLGLQARRLERAEQAAAVGAQEALARAVEAQANADQALRVDRSHQIVRGIERVTVSAIHEARTADDADIPLDPDRVARLHAHDRELCRLSPDLDGCAAAPDPA